MENTLFQREKTKGNFFFQHDKGGFIILTEIDGPLISRKSMLRNKSHSTSSSTVGYRLSGDSKIICSTSTTFVYNKRQQKSNTKDYHAQFHVI